VVLIELSLGSFRNLDDAEYRFGEKTNVILGPNGAGKSSLLEALAVLGNLRSFRTTHLRRAVRHGEAIFRLRGVISSGGRTHRLEQTVEVGPPLSRDLRVDGSAVDVERFLQLLPVFTITSHDRELVAGPPETRRAFLDRLAFLLRPPYLEEIRNYRRLLRQRNAALGSGTADAEIEAWETPLAAAAARVVEGRHDGVRVLEERFSEVWSVLSKDAAPKIDLAYRTEPWNEPLEGHERVEVLYRQRYNETRTRDRQMGFTVDGPHRHDLSLKTDGRSVRYVLSSGQTKAVAAALRLATLAQVERKRDERFPVIVDDVDAELDSAALKVLIEYLGSERQLFLSSTSEQVAELAGPQGHCLRIENGTCVSQEAARDD
jgi:DNA replication and repair protein RecF